MGVRTIKIELEDIIDSIYTFILKTCLHDEHQPITAYFEYLWVPTTPGKPNVTIPFTRRGVSIDVERVGMSFKYETRVKDANWTCGKFEVPLLPLSVK